MLSNNRWRVVLAGSTILMCLGVAYSWGVFLMPIEQTMGWGRAKISVAVSVLLLVFSVFMPIGGFLEKRFRAHNIATLGGLLVGFGWILASFSRSPLGLYLSYGVLSGIGTGLSYMPSISSGVKCFPEKKGLITGTIVFGFGFGAAFLSPLITRFIAVYGWRITMMILGVALGTVIVAASRFLNVSATPVAVFPDGATAVQSRDFSPGQMTGTVSFKIMFATYFLAMVAGMMTISHIVAFVSDKNFSLIEGAFALTLLSAFNGLGRISFGCISDRWGGKKTLILLFWILGSGMFLLARASGLSFIYFFSAIIGLCFGGFLAVYPPLTADYFGRRDFAVNYGLVFLGYGGGCFLGPLIGGLIHDVTKSYLPAFYIASLLASTGGILCATCLKKPR